MIQPVAQEFDELDELDRIVCRTYSGATYDRMLPAAAHFLILAVAPVGLLCRGTLKGRCPLKVLWPQPQGQGWWVAGVAV